MSTKTDGSSLWSLERTAEDDGRSSASDGAASGRGGWSQDCRAPGNDAIPASRTGVDGARRQRVGTGHDARAGGPDADRAPSEQLQAAAGCRDGPAGGRRSATAGSCVERRTDPLVCGSARRAAGGEHPDRVAPSGVPLHLRGRQPQGDQRLCAPWRPDVPEPGHARRRQNRRRSRWGHGSRAESRRPAPWHRTGDQGPEVPDGRHRRSGARRDCRRAHRQRHCPGIAVRARRLLHEIQPRVPTRGGSDGGADHGASRLRPAADGQHVPDDPEAGWITRARVAQRSPGPGQPIRVDQP